MAHTTKIDLPWGTGTLSFRLPRSNLAGVYRPAPMPPCSDVAAEVRRALSTPLGTPRLSTLVHPGEHIALLIDDHTRSTPAAAILPAVLAELDAAGVAARDITLVITHGTHRLSTPEEVRRKVGPELYGRLRLVQHTCDDEANQVYLGLTSRGTPVWLNRLVVEADRRIGIGHIGPSPYAGYSGGNKLLIPGVAALDTINANHSLVVLGEGRPGDVTVPCRQDIDEAAALLGLDMVIDVVLNHDERVIAALAGSAERVYAEGVALARQVFEVGCPAQLDIAVTSGFPYELDLYQAERAVEYADAVVRQGGSIILTATCPDGVGGDEFYRLMSAPGKGPDGFLRDIVRRNGKVTFSVLGYILARIRAEKRLYVVSDGIPAQALEAMGLQHLPMLQPGLDALLAEYGPQARVAVFPMGASTIPVPERC